MARKKLTRQQYNQKIRKLREKGLSKKQVSKIKSGTLSKNKVKRLYVPRYFKKEKKLEIAREFNNFKRQYIRATNNIKSVKSIANQLGFGIFFKDFNVKYKNLREYKQQLINITVKAPKIALNDVTKAFIENYNIPTIKKISKSYFKKPREILKQLILGSDLTQESKNYYLDLLDNTSDNVLGGIDIAEFAEFLLA